MHYNQLRRKFDDRQLEVDAVERDNAQLSNDHRIMCNNLKKIEEDRDNLKQKRADTEDETAYLIKFNEELSNKVEDMVARIRELKNQQKGNQEQLRTLEDAKLLQKDQEENLIRHSLTEVQDQGLFHQRDNERATKQRDNLQVTKAKLIAVTSKIQCEIEYMIQMDRNLTRQLQLRNDDCEAQLKMHDRRKELRVSVEGCPPRESLLPTTAPTTISNNKSATMNSFASQADKNLEADAQSQTLQNSVQNHSLGHSTQSPAEKVAAAPPQSRALQNVRNDVDRPYSLPVSAS